MAAMVTATAQLVLLSDFENPTFRPIISLSGDVSIGRASNSGIVWQDERISRNHATLEYNSRGRRWTIQDSSSNGIFINQSRLLKGVVTRLCHGDTIAFLPNDEVLYRFQYVPLRNSTSGRSLNGSACINGCGATSSLQVPTAKRSRLSVNNGVGGIGKNLASTQHSSSNNEESEYDKASRVPALRRKRSDFERFLSFPRLRRNALKSTGSFSGVTKPSFKISNSARGTGNVAMTDAEIDACSDMKTLKEQLKSTQGKLAIAERRLLNTEFDRARLDYFIKFQRAEKNAALKEKTKNEIIAVLESEMKCVVCNDVFIRPAILQCGHTFCLSCIQEWSTNKTQCPICRKGFSRSKLKCHVEFENFIAKMYDSFKSREISTRRNDLIEEHRKEILKRDEALRQAGNPSTSRDSQEVEDDEDEAFPVPVPLIRRIMRALTRIHTEGPSRRQSGPAQEQPTTSSGTPAPPSSSTSGLSTRPSAGATVRFVRVRFDEPDDVDDVSPNSDPDPRAEAIAASPNITGEEDADNNIIDMTVVSISQIRD